MGIKETAKEYEVSFEIMKIMKDFKVGCHDGYH